MNARVARLLRRSNLPHATQRDLKRKWPTFSHRRRAEIALELAELGQVQAARRAAAQFVP